MKNRNLSWSQPTNTEYRIHDHLMVFMLADEYLPFLIVRELNEEWYPNQRVVDNRYH